MVNKNSDLSVLIDARLTFHAGIGRYSLNLCRFLLEHTCSPGLTIISPAGLNKIFKEESQKVSFLNKFPDRYTIGELLGLYYRITRGSYHIFHTTNYIIPPRIQLPSIVTIHDVMRLRLPEYCHSNSEFIRRFGIGKFISISTITNMLLLDHARKQIKLSNYRSRNLTDSRLSYNYLSIVRKEFKLHHLYIYLMNLLAIQNASVIVTVSEFSKKEIMEIFDVNHEKIHVIYPGIDPNFHILGDPVSLRAIMNRLGIPSSKYFLHVGLKRQHKNLITLIRAFSEYVKQNIDPPYLILVGPNDEDFEYLRKYSYYKGMDYRLFFLNNIDDEELNVLYNGAIALLVPSIYEGFGFPMVEAMACGTPVVASNIPIVSEICGDSVLPVSPLDVSAWVKALNIISKNIELKNLLRERSVKQIRRFNWQLAVSQIIDLYRFLATNVQFKK